MLLEDSPPKKTFSYFRQHISKGELLQIKYNQWIVAYSDPPVFVDCQWMQRKTVDPKFIPYLFAVQSLTFRHDLFVNRLNSLMKFVLLNVGDKIDVILEQNVVPSAAIIRYKGELPTKMGIFFGVEILVS